jgi:ribosomal protein S18 acetylase RimI-like enzyme
MIWPHKPQPRTSQGNSLSDSVSMTYVNIQMAPIKPTSSIIIRPMQDSDTAMIRRGLSETNWQDIPVDQRRFLNRVETDRRIFEDFDRYLRTERFKFKVFCAVSHVGKPIGYVSIGENSNPAVGLPLGAVLDFWVEPEHRNKGVGGMLLDYAIDQIRIRGYTHASILVSASNKTAIGVYERRGFHPDRISMTKQLKT